MERIPPVDKIVAKITKEPKLSEEPVDANNIEFVLNPVESAPIGDVEKLVKSKAALETLLALAKTYIEMDDIETAKQSLQEVVDFGNKKQQAEAQRLLDELSKK